MKRQALWSLLTLLAMAAGGAAPGAADWLVTTDGSRVETKGPWKVDGRRVIFTLPNGTLSAMRASEIDFEASEAATAAANAPPPAPVAEDAKKEPLPEPVLVLTNKDIAPGAVPDDPDAPARPEVLPSIAEREPVQVISWNRYEQDDGSIELRGTVRNTGASVAANIRVQATVKDEDGAEIATGNAFLGKASLVSGRSTTFRVVLPDVDDFTGNPEFKVTSTELTIGGAARPRETARDDDAETEDTETDDDSEPASELNESNAEGGDDDARP